MHTLPATHRRQATNALSRLQRALLLATCIVFFLMTRQTAFLLVAAGMIYRLFTRDTPAEPSTRTAAFFTILLFALGALLKIVPSSPSTPNGCPMIPEGYRGVSHQQPQAR